MNQEPRKRPTAHTAHTHTTTWAQMRARQRQHTTRNYHCKMNVVHVLISILLFVCVFISLLNHPFHCKQMRIYLKINNRIRRRRKKNENALIVNNNKKTKLETIAWYKEHKIFSCVSTLYYPYTFSAVCIVAIVVAATAAAAAASFTVYLQLVVVFPFILIV